MTDTERIIYRMRISYLPDSALVDYERFMRQQLASGCPGSAEIIALISSEVQDRIIAGIRIERIRQDDKHGNPCIRMLPDGLSREICKLEADRIKADNDRKTLTGCPDWLGIILEEVYEAFAELPGPAAECEFTQVSAVGVKIIENIRKGNVI